MPVGDESLHRPGAACGCRCELPDRRGEAELGPARGPARRQPAHQRHRPPRRAALLRGGFHPGNRPPADDRGGRLRRGGAGAVFQQSGRRGVGCRRHRAGLGLHQERAVHRSGQQLRLEQPRHGLPPRRQRCARRIQLPLRLRDRQQQRHRGQQSGEVLPLPGRGRARAALRAGNRRLQPAKPLLSVRRGLARL